jgi:outer membrane receptor protein involved in Fe transport
VKQKKSSGPIGTLKILFAGVLMLDFAVPFAHGETPTSPDQTIYVHVSPLSASGVNIRKFPHQVQVLRSQDLSQNGVANATQALSRRVAGVNIVNSQANPYQPTILYHGFELSPIQGTPAGLSVYVNGARFNTPFGDLAIWSLLPDEAIYSLSLEDGNPVFGLNALGGAINVIMKNGFNTSGGQIELSGGSFGKVDANLEYGKQIGNAAAYIDLGEAHESGWRNAQSSDIQNFYGDVGWRGPHAELHLNATLANSNLNGPGSVPVQLLAADPAAQFTGPNNITDKYAKLSATLEDQLTAATSLQGVLYYDNLRENLINGNGANDQPCGPGLNAGYLCQGGVGGSLSTAQGGMPIPNFLPNANAAGYYSYAQLNLNTTNTNGYGGSFQLTNTTPFFGLKNSILAGLSYDGGFTNYNAAGYIGGLTSTSRFYYTPPGIPSPGYLLDEPGTVPVSVVIRNAYYGAYMSDTLNLTQKLALTASGRFNIANIALHDQNPPNPNAPGGGLTGRHYYDHFNPAIGATYDVTELLTVYGSYSEANAAPTPAELSCASPQDSCSLANFMSGDPNLKQIVTHTFEAGLKGTLIGPLESIIVYNADYYDAITSDDIEFLQSPYNPISSGYFGNVGNVERTGVDAGVHLSFNRLQIYGSYSRIDATYRSSFIEHSNNPNANAQGNITVLPGDHLPGIPENIVKFGAAYQATRRWNAGISVTAQTSTFLYGDAANLTPPAPGYIVVDLTTRYDVTPNLQVFGGIDNVMNARYYNYGTFSPTGLAGGVYVAQAPNYSNPRSYSIAAPIGVYAGMKYRF